MVLTAPLVGGCVDMAAMVAECAVSGKLEEINPICSLSDRYSKDVGVSDKRGLATLPKGLGNLCRRTRTERHHRNGAKQARDLGKG